MANDANPDINTTIPLERHMRAVGLRKESHYDFSQVHLRRTDLDPHTSYISISSSLSDDSSSRLGADSWNKRRSTIMDQKPEKWYIKSTEMPNSSTIFSRDSGLLELRLGLEAQAAAEFRPHYPANEACQFLQLL